jgi:hypothetical protein
MPTQESQNLVATDTDARKKADDGGGVVAYDDDTVDTTVTCNSASCHGSPLSDRGGGRYYGSVEDNHPPHYYGGYPESMFLVDKTPGTKEATDEGGGPPRQQHDMWAKKQPSPLMITSPSRSSRGESWYLKWKESNAVMWLGHFAFIAGAICYLQGALVDLDWARFSLVDHFIPGDILEADDDASWTSWEKTNLDKKTMHDIDRTREHYWDYSSLFCMLGGTFFVACGLFDTLYYCEFVDMFMVFAGIAGVLSATSDSDRMEGVWNFISCHMYLLEAYSMLRRQRQDIDEMGEKYDGYYFFLLSRMCFLGGCLLDVSCFDSIIYLFLLCYLVCIYICSKYIYVIISWQIVVSYIELSPWESGWLDVYSDLTSCSLWMLCAIIDICAELYFLEREDEVEKVAEKPLVLSV